MRVVEGVIADAQIDIEQARTRIRARDQGPKRSADLDRTIVGELVCQKVDWNRLLLQIIEGPAQLVLQAGENRIGAHILSRIRCLRCRATQPDGEQGIRIVSCRGGGRRSIGRLFPSLAGEAEVNLDIDHQWYGLAIQSCWLELPLLHRIDRFLVKTVTDCASDLDVRWFSIR